MGTGIRKIFGKHEQKKDLTLLGQSENKKALTSRAWRKAF
jgi:hypothetical protein